MSPNLKPSRMPCFTQVFTRQPNGLDASGSAARTAPDDSASRSRTKRLARHSAIGRRTGRDQIRSTCCLERHARSAPFKRPSSLSTRMTFSRDSGLAATIGRRIDLFDESHRGHRRLHRAWIRLDEVGRHQRQDPRRWMARAAAKSLRSAASTSWAISPGISFDATEMTPRPPTARSGSVNASSPHSTRKLVGHARGKSRTSATCCPMLP